MKLTAGDHVELVSLGCTGTVAHADLQYVRVEWDDGTVGLLYFELGMIPNANHLQKLQREALAPFREAQKEKPT